MVRKSACNAGDLGSIHRSGRSPGEGNGNSLEYSFLENPMDRGAWQASVRRITESDTTEWQMLSLSRQRNKDWKTLYPNVPNLTTKTKKVKCSTHHLFYLSHGGASWCWKLDLTTTQSSKSLPFCRAFSSCPVTPPGNLPAGQFQAHLTHHASCPNSHHSNVIRTNQAQSEVRVPDSLVFYHHNG